jgi:hypothetical protein
MARAALQWRTVDLSNHSKVAVPTINRFEVGRTSSNRATMTVIRQTFEAAGIVFLDNGGVVPPAAELESGP